MYFRVSCRRGCHVEGGGMLRWCGVRWCGVRCLWVLVECVEMFWSDWSDSWFFGVWRKMEERFRKL